MADRMAGMIVLDGGAADDPVALHIDASGPGVPRILHFGPAWGETEAAPTPKIAWGARLAEPPPLTLLPTEGRGWFGEPALSIRPNGSAWLDLRLAGSERAADAVTFTMEDKRAGITVQLSIALDGETGVAVSRAALIAAGGAEVRWLAAGCWPLPEHAGEVLALSGAWADEFRVDRLPCPPGLFERGSRRGRSSHEAYPGVVVGETGFGEDHGVVWGVTLGWSGNHRWLLEPLEDGGRQLQIGERLAPGEVVLGPGEWYETPPAYAAVSARGLNGLRARLHGHVRRRVLPPAVAARPRPVTLNTWEAMYFDQDEGKVLALAEEAAALGVERFVLDDGWFRGRDDDRRALGDWTPDCVKHPRGLGPIAERVRALGMSFGLWVEPEMVNPDSDLNRAHPDWALGDAGREPLLARNQLVLDLTRPAVTEHLFGVLDGLLRSAPIDYLKWDMNRPLTDAATRDGRPAGRAYGLALHGLIDRVRTAHPGVEIEACASGGGRADWSMLARSERVWTSDNLDPLDRLRIQEGASLFLPPEMMGAHVGARTAHVTGRTTGLTFRAHVAMFGAFGVEASPSAMDGADREALRLHIAEHKRLRPLLHGGRQRRVTVDEDHTAILALDEGAEHGLLALYRTGSRRAGRPATMRLHGLEAGRSYALRVLQPLERSLSRSLAEDWLAGDVRQTGAALAAVGLTFQLPRPETSLLVELIGVAG